MNKYSFENLRLLLVDNKVDFKVITHSPVFTMEDVARELSINQKTMAKTMLLIINKKELLRVVLPGMARLNVKQLSLIIAVPRTGIQFADKKTIEQAGLTVGAIPPFGGNFPTYIDTSLLDQDALYCGAGDNNKTFFIKTSDIIRISSASIANISDSSDITTKKWRKPNLNIEGQKSFWDNQADIYENTDMTIDNYQEMDVVLSRCKEISCNDIITLGGAIGCRDPKMILENILSRKHPEPLPKVIFNDLSERRVQWAKEKILKKFDEAGIKITYLPGEIKNVCQNIDKNRPRRLIVGVYNCKSFFEPYPSDGYPLCGFDEYLKNYEILGENLYIDWIKYTLSNGLSFCNACSQIKYSDYNEKKLTIKNTLKSLYQDADNGKFGDVIGLQIIGTSNTKKGFFLSHWYIPNGFKSMLKNIFPPDSFSISESYFAKGMVFTIDPLNSTPYGVVTILNNVIGNILPCDQIETLVAIKKIVSG